MASPKKDDMIPMKCEVEVNEQQAEHPAQSLPDWHDFEISLRRFAAIDIKVSFESFPYYLSENTKEELCSCAYAHLVCKKKLKLASLSSLNRFMLLSGSAGSEIYQENIAMALAKEFGAGLLMYEPLPLPSDESLRHKFRFLVEAASRETKNGPSVIFLSDIFVRDVEKAVLSNVQKTTILSEEKEKSSGLKEVLDSMPEGVIVIGSHIQRHPYGDFYCNTSQYTSTQAICLPLQEIPTKAHQLSEIFPNKVTIEVPEDESAEATGWKQKLKADAETLNARRNNARIQSILNKAGWQCSDLETVCIKDKMLTDQVVDRMVGVAITHHLKRKRVSTDDDNIEFVLSGESIKHGFNVSGSAKSVPAPNPFRRTTKARKKAFGDVVFDNEFEEMLLDNVVPANEIAVTFEDIGALGSVKDTLRELVMLPLQRPELFRKGQLTKPCKGILLFGPPGTGKTMLAKAVATEAGANFINISAASITSKWYGDAEKYAKAVFSLASKIAPSVIFIDEVDSVLGSRGSSGEYEASRRVKNEFMMSWDGLCTKEQERVLVLAATNRPFDLDEAVIRRLPRRLMVSLPDSSNREKILRVMMSKEDLAPDFDLVDIANMTDGYSGSDLKNLCVAAAHRPIREILEKEEEERSLALADGRTLPPLHSGDNIRPLELADFKYAHGQVGASASSESDDMNKLLKWNDMYGEGGSKKKEVTSYFL